MPFSVKRLDGRWMVLLLSVVSLASTNPDLRLVEAVENRDPEIVRSLLKQRIDVNARQADGATALHWAAHWDDLDTADLLIRAGAAVDARNDLGVTPLSLASTNGSPAMLEMLLKAGANPNATVREGQTPLMTAARTGRVDAVKVLLAHGVDVNARETSQGQTALMWAVSGKHPDVVQVLVESGADVHVPSRGGFTPLLFAAREGDLVSARILVGARANVNDAAPDDSQSLSELGGVGKNDTRIVSPLLVATVRGHRALAAFLLDQGADPNANGAGYTALHWVAGSWESELTGAKGVLNAAADAEWTVLGGLRTGRLEWVKMLVAHGANPNVRLVKRPPVVGYTKSRNFYDGSYNVNLVGATPFLLAAKDGDVSVMRALADNGADPRLATTDNTTPLMVAAGLGRVASESRVTESQAFEAVKLALALGGDVNAANDAGDTALHGAASVRSNILVQFLVDQGARVNVKNRKEETPLTHAERTLQFAGFELFVTERTSTGDLLRKLGGH